MVSPTSCRLDCPCSLPRARRRELAHPCARTVAPCSRARHRRFGIAYSAGKLAHRRPSMACLFDLTVPATRLNITRNGPDLGLFVVRCHNNALRVLSTSFACRRSLSRGSLCREREEPDHISLRELLP